LPSYYFHSAACTKDVAEYKILIAVLEYCVKRDLRLPDVRMDKALVVNQVMGRWGVRQTHLLDLWSRASALKAQVHTNLTWVSGDEIKLFLGH